MADAHAITDRNGVKKPILNETEIREITKTPATIRGVEDKSERFAAFIRKIAATEIRRSNNARPGRP
jgi:hypothetical protein